MRSGFIIGLRLFGCLLVPLAVGGISGYATASSIHGWYEHLIKPSFNPPNYLFGPVWTLLYTLMGVALFIILNSPKSDARTQAVKIFAIQLILNFFWSFLFFKFNLLGIALIEIILMLLSIGTMIKYFSRVNKLAAYLQIPYLLWVSFATMLNGAIWMLN
jgi:translocator protein